jgi:DNA-damage-inducible protein J
MENGLPFDMRLTYNQETLDAIQEARDIMSGKIKTKSYTSVAEMHAAIDAMVAEDEDA